MYIRPQFRIGFSLSQDLARNRCRVSFSKKNISGEVNDRVAFAPAKINVRYFSGLVSEIQQKRGDSVRHGGRFGPQDPVTVDLYPANIQLTLKLRGVAKVDLIEQYWIG